MSVTLLDLFDLFGVADSDERPGFYNQDWWQAEPFATRPVRAGYIGHGPIKMEYKEPHVAGMMMSVTYGIGEIPDPEGLPNAAEVALHFFRAWHRSADDPRPWSDRFVWTSDNDRNGDRIYVGGYDLGRRPGFQVHRHLTIRDQHVAVPWVPAR